MEMTKMQLRQTLKEAYDKGYSQGYEEGLKDQKGEFEPLEDITGWMDGHDGYM